jgi:subtilisin-like proprotein convertase family protein
MKTKQILGITAGLMVWAGTVVAQTTETSFTFSVNQLVPDANKNGVFMTTNLNITGGTISDVTVSLDITGGYNGDLFAFLSGPNGGYAVLLNRVGVSNDASSFGYGNHGFDIVLSDSAANDVHYYQSASYLLNGSGQLTGTWVPDGRTIDPLYSPPSLFGSTAPSALLGSFNGTDPNGGWTLFLADLSVGSQSQLVSWSLDVITAVPEPSVVALGIMGLGLLAGMGKISGRSKMK